MKYRNTKEIICFLISTGILVFVYIILRKIFRYYGMDWKLADYTSLFYSAAINYLINKHIVFKKGEFSRIEMMKYMLLWAAFVFVSIIFCGEYFVNINVITYFLYSAFIVISYLIQKYWIFNCK